ncbi:zinc finger and SCAN domain-containing protein 32-like isoform 2-T3 [Liasis olivaceus]
MQILGLKRPLEAQEICRPLLDPCRNGLNMDANLPACEGVGKGPAPAQPRSCGEVWAGTGQRVLEEEALSSEIQHWRFRNSPFQEAEGPRELCSRLHRLCWGWLRPEKHTKAQMLDRVILEQFVAVLPTEMQRWMRECRVEASSQAVALAEGFLLSRAEEKEQEGHQVLWSFLEVSTNCPEERMDPANPTQESCLRGISKEEGQHQDASLGKGRSFYGVGGFPEILLILNSLYLLMSNCWTY